MGEAPVTWRQLLVHCPAVATPLVAELPPWGTLHIPGALVCALLAVVVVVVVVVQ